MQLTQTSPHQSHTPSTIKIAEDRCRPSQTPCTMFSTSQSQSLKLPVVQSPQSPRSTSASYQRGHKHTVKIKDILQVITSFYRRPEVLILVPYTRVDFHYPHNWLGYETPILNKNYLRKDFISSINQVLCQVLQGVVGWVKPTQGQPSIFS